MNKFKLLLPTLPFIVGVFTAISVAKTSFVPAIGEMGSENPPTQLNVDPFGNTYFYDGDPVAYDGWTFTLTLTLDDPITSETEILDLTLEDVSTDPAIGDYWVYGTSSVTITYSHPYGDDLVAYVDIYVESVTPPDECEIDPSSCEGPGDPYPSDLLFNSLPDKQTYFIGDVFDLTGLVVEVILSDSSSLPTFQDESLGELTITNQTPSNVWNGDIISMDFTTITVVYTDANLYQVSNSFSLSIYEVPNYSYDFTQSSLAYSSFNPLNGRDELVLGTAGDSFLFKADNNAQNIEIPVALDPNEGFVIGDGITNPTNASFLSKYIWGQTGSSNGKPAIKKLLINAYDNGVSTEMIVKINNQTIQTSFLGSSGNMNDNYFLVDVSSSPAYGHIEIEFLQAFGNSPIVIREWHIFSSAETDSTISGILSLAYNIEALGTCGDNSSFVSTKEADYNSYFSSKPSFMNNLLLIDYSGDIATPLNKDELRVSLTSKWDMVYSLYTSAPGTGNQIETQFASISPVTWMFLIFLVINIPTAIFFITRRREI